MCSKRCAKPVRPGNSFAGPTWYHRLTATSGSRWSSERMTSRPFSSLYFSNFSCGVSSGAGLAAGFFVCVGAGAFFAPDAVDCAGAACCAADGIAKIQNAAAPSDKTLFEYAFIKVPFDWTQIELN